MRTAGKPFPLGVFAGGLTIAGVASIVAAMLGHANPAVASSLLWFYLLCAGGVCTLVGGITWAHTRGNRVLKTILMGAAGAVGGALLGGYLGNEIPGNESANIVAVLLGSCIGAILLAALGAWWGIRITRRLAHNAVVFAADPSENKV